MLFVVDPGHYTSCLSVLVRRDAHLCILSLVIVVLILNIVAPKHIANNRESSSGVTLELLGSIDEKILGRVICLIRALRISEIVKLGIISTRDHSLMMSNPKGEPY